MWWNNIWRRNKSKITTPSPGNTTAPELINVVVKTDVGNIRSNNEDAAIYLRVANKETSQSRGSLMMVADGMGGHQAGEVASRIATEVVCQEYFNSKKNWSVTEALRHAYGVANNRILKLAASNTIYRGMGTTCTAIVISGDDLYFAHVGDSRAYLFKDEKLHRVTEDHTYVQELLRNNEIKPEEVSTHPKRNILTNAMGTKANLTVDVGKYALKLEVGNKILICSDGLSEYFSDDELLAKLSATSINIIADQLITEAKQRGGHDNITVILAEPRSAIGTPSPETRDIYIPITQEYNLP
jgi:PPM family protein phosphatase